MTKIKLQSIAINNFKGIRFLKLNMEGKTSNIQGANGSGKTTIYKAYYWCLTGKTIELNETVQTLDQDNEVVHKIETSVEIVLMIDDSYEVTIKRCLVEKWRALGMPDEQFTGTEQKQFFNEIPLNKNEFNAKLNSICDLDKWTLLSNISAFLSLKTEEKRKMLMDMAGEVNEEELLSSYPALIKAVNVEKKSVEELQKQTISTKKRSNDELKTIPSQIEAQDRLRVNTDFNVVKTEIIQLDRDIADADRLLEGSTEELESTKELNNNLNKLRNELNAAIDRWNAKHSKDYEAANKEVEDARLSYREAIEDKKEVVNGMVIKAAKIKELETSFNEKKKEWEKVNQITYTEKNLTSCPTCGHIFTKEEKIEKGKIAIEHFNKDKSERLQTLLEEATKINEQKTALTGSYNEDKQIILPQKETLLASAKTALDKKIEALQSIKEENIDNDEQIITLKQSIEKEVSKISAPSEDNNKESIRAKKNEFITRRDELTKILAGEDTNNRIEEEKERLNKRAKELAQIVADCDNILYQIMEYKKAKVNTIESKINGLFKIARWKFFRKNIGDDNYNEVCECLHNGIDYNSTNAADKINLGIDIVSTIGKAYGIEAVIFVDFRESVANLLEVDNQIISLEHIAKAPLTLNN